MNSPYPMQTHALGTRCPGKFGKAIRSLRCARPNIQAWHKRSALLSAKSVYLIDIAVWC